ncbi:MAG TPA: hypothetical protein VGP19_04735 [Candidatus Acidoferrales bacterium]|jgi:hypothetical protein|nr:hypothetical protein [Candidatus Acidoferrales bacterium]
MSAGSSAALHGITHYGDDLYRTGKLPVMSPIRKLSWRIPFLSQAALYRDGPHALFPGKVRAHL